MRWDEEDVIWPEDISSSQETSTVSAEGAQHHTYMSKAVFPDLPPTESQKYVEPTWWKMLLDECDPKVFYFLFILLLLVVMIITIAMIYRFLTTNAMKHRYTRLVESQQATYNDTSSERHTEVNSHRAQPSTQSMHSHENASFGSFDDNASHGMSNIYRTDLTRSVVRPPTMIRQVNETTTALVHRSDNNNELIREFTYHQLVRSFQKEPIIDFADTTQVQAIADVIVACTNSSALTMVLNPYAGPQSQTAVENLHAVAQNFCWYHSVNSPPYLRWKEIRDETRIVNSEQKSNQQLLWSMVWSNSADAMLLMVVFIVLTATVTYDWRSIIVPESCCDAYTGHSMHKTKWFSLDNYFPFLSWFEVYNQCIRDILKKFGLMGASILVSWYLNVSLPKLSAAIWLYWFAMGINPNLAKNLIENILLLLAPTVVANWPIYIFRGWILDASNRGLVSFVCGGRSTRYYRFRTFWKGIVWLAALLSALYATSNYRDAFYTMITEHPLVEAIQNIIKFQRDISLSRDHLGSS